MYPCFTRIAVCLFALLAALWATPAFCQAQKPQLVVQVGHKSAVTSVCFSPDGKTLASGDSSGTIKIWAVATGQLLHTLNAGGWGESFVSFNFNGETLASGGSNNSINLWDTASGKLRRTLTGHTATVISATFSPDGQTLASASLDDTLKFWDTTTGELLCTLNTHSRWDGPACFSPDSKILAIGSENNHMKLYDVATGKELYTLAGQKDFVSSVVFSRDSKTLASGSNDHTVKLWDVETGHLLHTLTGDTSQVRSLSFSPNGKLLASSSGNIWDITTGHMSEAFQGAASGSYSIAYSPDGKTLATDNNDVAVKLWDAVTGKVLHTLTSYTGSITSVAFSPDGRTLASSSRNWGDSVKLWDPVKGQLQELHTLTGCIGWVLSIAFSRDGKILANGRGDDKSGTVQLWDTNSRHLRHTLSGHTGVIWSVAFSPNGKILASSSWDRTVNLWDTLTGRELRTLTGQTDVVNSLAFSPDGKTLAGASLDNTIYVWSTETGRLQRTLTGHTLPSFGFSTELWPLAARPKHNGTVNSVTFSADGGTLACGNNSTIEIWNAATGQLLHTLTGHEGEVKSVAFSPDGKTLASGSVDKTIKIWDTATGQLLHTLAGHTGIINSVAFSPEGKSLASGSDDQTIKLWNLATSRESATLYSLGDDDWAVVTPDGRFDASPGGMAQMHYVVGLEPIDLAQLKDRYYEPGLLAKLLGFNKEPLRDVRAFDHVDLTPEVKIPDTVPADGKLPLTLTNRGGGIGRVQVFVNGKELLADARGPQADPNAKTAALTVDVSQAPGLVPGKPNTVRIVTWNAEGYLSSRGTEALYTPLGQDAPVPPDLWAIVAGISDYAGPSLHLTYSAKDAADFAHALTLGAKNLFGANKVHLTLLDTGGQPGAILPTKANLQQAFQEARKAKHGDIFVVYLAGHGVALTGEHDLYCYLTQDATTGSAAALGADSQLRQATSVSSEELTDWIKQVPAQKQVMVLDTCAAGAAATLLTAKRDIPSDQIRAIERLKDRTGFYVLMGCAADAVSYETSQYRQGLLTYSLLKGMKGASLRDGQFVDVSDLFNYAVDEVPQLAQNIGGVQRPFVAAPDAGSFDVGELSAADRQAIPLASAGMLVLRPELVAEDEDLGLEALLAARLREMGAASARGDVDAPAVSFVDASDFPGAIHPQGTYTVSGQTIAVKLRLRRDGKLIKSLNVTGTRANLSALVTKLANMILGAAGV